MRLTQMNAGGAPIMPLLMGCTKPQPIETLEHDERVIYDPIAQVVQIDMRTIGTRSLRTSNTRYKINKLQTSTKPDRKNEIDDSKIVK